MSKYYIENIEDLPLLPDIERENEILSFKPITPTVNEPAPSMGVVDIYFAKREVVFECTDITDGKTTYTFPEDTIIKDSISKNNIIRIIQESVSDDLKANNQCATDINIEEALTKNAYTAGETISFDVKKMKKTFSYPKITYGYITQEVYLVVITYNLAGSEVTIEIKEETPKILLASASDSLPVIIPETGEETLQVTVPINEDEIGAVLIALRPKCFTKNDSEEENLSSSMEGWSECLENHEQHTLLSFNVVEEVRNIRQWFINNAFKLVYTVVVFIYPDGSLSKIGRLKYKKQIIYMYVGLDKVFYQICICDLQTVPKRKNGAESSIQPGYTKEVKYEHAKGRIKYIYPNGDVIVKEGTKILAYKIAGEEEIELVKAPDSLQITLPGKALLYGLDQYTTFKFQNTVRTYCAPLQFAGFIGAWIEAGIAIVSEGMCEGDGSSFPSITHPNGESIDTGYIYTANGQLDFNRQQKFINAMHKFGFKDQLKGESSVFRNLTNARPYPFHNDHLHSGGFVPKWKKNNQQASAVV